MLKIQQEVDENLHLICLQSVEPRHRAGESVPRRDAEVCGAGEEGEGQRRERDGEEDEQQGHGDVRAARTGTHAAHVPPSFHQSTGI